MIKILCCTPYVYQTPLEPNIKGDKIYCLVFYTSNSILFVFSGWLKTSIYTDFYCLKDCNADKSVFDHGNNTEINKDNFLNHYEYSKFFELKDIFRDFKIVNILE
jgi:hypothetical protein